MICEKSCNEPTCEFQYFFFVHLVDSTGALDLKEIPKSMVVIGGGVIGLEMGSVYKRLGADVTVVEYLGTSTAFSRNNDKKFKESLCFYTHELDRLIPGTDNEIAKEFLKTLKKQKFKFEMGMKVLNAETGADGVTLTLEPAKGGDQKKINADVVLLATGRRPYTDGLGLEVHLHFFSINKISLYPEHLRVCSFRT